jgi:hypothetical protein
MSFNEMFIGCVVVFLLGLLHIMVARDFARAARGWMAVLVLAAVITYVVAQGP